MLQFQQLVLKNTTLWSTLPQIVYWKKKSWVRTSLFRAFALSVCRALRQRYTTRCKSNWTWQMAKIVRS